MAAQYDEDMPHPYASYNREEQVPTLIGNWQEERALKEKTSVPRYETWAAAQKEEATTIYAVKQDASPQMPTHPRVLEHDEQTAAADWTSVTKVSYLNPKSAPALVEFKNIEKLGPRAKMEMQLLMQEAKRLPPAVEHTLTGIPIPPQLETTYRGDFLQHDLTGMTIGARAMKDLDGRPAVRDPTFLAETQIVPREVGDRVFGKAAVSSGATQTVLLPDPDVAVTIYSEAVATRKYGSTCYGTRPVAGAVPFGKSTNFTKPMSDYSKVVVDE